MNVTDLNANYSVLSNTAEAYRSNYSTIYIMFTISINRDGKNSYKSLEIKRGVTGNYDKISVMVYNMEERYPHLLIKDKVGMGVSKFYKGLIQ